MIRKILGPPGTGKTTRLIKYVKTFVKLGTPWNSSGMLGAIESPRFKASLYNHANCSADEHA